MSEQFRNRISENIFRRPVVLTLLVGLLLLSILLVRGLNIGPLQTDVIIIRAWFQQVGVSGFSQRYFETNQRHILAGPVIALGYAFFGECDLPYHVIFQLSRVLEGVFLAGIVYELTRRRALAICAGLALTTTAIRVAQLYQGINWFIEPTLALLLASSWIYLLSLKARRYRLSLYLASLALYLISISIYESGIPWIGVNLLLGYLAREGQPPRIRIWRALRDAMPGIVAGVTLTVLVLFVFTPWTGLAPDASAGSPLRILSQLGTTITFPRLYADTLRILLGDGYAGLIAGFAVVGGVVGALMAVVIHSTANRREGAQPPYPPTPFPHASGGKGEIRREPSSEIFNDLQHEREGKQGQSHSDKRHITKREFGLLVLLALVMVLSTVLVGTSNQIGQEYLDRITFGRAAGIMLLYVTMIFGVCSLIPVRWREALAVVATGVILIGPGFAAMWAYQEYAHQARAEVERIAAGVIEVRKLIYVPAHLVILTDPDWVLTKWTDASDAVLHDTQNRLYKLNEPATIDFLKMGMYAENYATLPGTCQSVNGQRSGGMCLGESALYNSRWAEGETHPYDQVVIVHWDWRTGTMTPVRQLALENLGGYNISSAGPKVLKTNPERVAVPVQ